MRVRKRLLVIALPRHASLHFWRAPPRADACASQLAFAPTCILCASHHSSVLAAPRCASSSSFFLWPQLLRGASVFAAATCGGKRSSSRSAHAYDLWRHMARTLVFGGATRPRVLRAGLFLSVEGQAALAVFAAAAVQRQGVAIASGARSRPLAPHVAHSGIRRGCGRARCARCSLRVSRARRSLRPQHAAARGCCGAQFATSGAA